MRLRARPGYSLVELAIVIAILGIMLAAAIPIDHVSDARIDAVIGKVASDIRYAQQMAMSTRLHTLIVFDTNANSYSIYIESSAGGAWSLMTDPAQNGPFTVTLGSGQWTGIDLTGAEFGNGSAKLLFWTMGEPRNGDSNDLPADAASRRIVISGRTITVEPETGALDY